MSHDLPVDADSHTSTPPLLLPLCSPLLRSFWLCGSFALVPGLTGNWSAIPCAR
ncbi:hypothetical protein BD311DRAFT_759073 [Dichomitus squalens]|uniref:Uncharacterized protein n=1 Tax=Dichomitus squalens TaxID=114155 RepID=A0A4Q9MKE6_9APHY|nr:hypothetical protein BD311DRAFT_759073 [Dichomitus squalens]